MPIGPWPKDERLRQAGLFFLVGVLDGISGLSMRVFTQGLGWAVEKMEVLLVALRKEWKNKNIHSYVSMSGFRLGLTPKEMLTLAAMSCMDRNDGAASLLTEQKRLRPFT